MGKFSLAAIAIAFSALASASSFDNLYVFGDSLSDTGNVYALTGGHTPPAPYYHGRFSNGPVWVESLANHLGLSVDPSLNGGTNYAFGGAEADRSHTLSHDNTPNIGYQITQFSASHSFTGHELVVVWAGGNDFLKEASIPLTSPQTLRQALISFTAWEQETFWSTIFPFWVRPHKS